MRHTLPFGFFLLMGCFNRAPSEVRPLFAQSGTQLEKTWVMYLLCDHRIVSAVWCDIDLSAPGSSSRSGNVKVCKPSFGHFSSIQSADGRLVEWCAQTREDKVLAVVINGKEFKVDNGDGDLFLVRTRHEGMPVTQVKVKLGGEPNILLWNRLTEQVDQVKEFMADACADK